MNNFNTEQQVRFDAITAKHMPIFEQSAKLAKEAKKALKGIPTKGNLSDENIDSIQLAAKLEKESKRLYKLATLNVSNEFWN